MSCAEDVDSTLSRLVAAKEHEHELLAQLDALLQTVDLPEYVASVVNHAREAFGTDAVRWLSTPHYNLSQQMPLRCAQSAEGAQRVEDLITRIVAGMPV